MLRVLCSSVALLFSLGHPALHPVQAGATVRSAPRISFTTPSSNVAASDPVLDASHIVYGFAVPRFHHPSCVSCGQKPFTNFRVHLYLRTYRPRSTSISKPRPLFIGPRGAQVILYSLARSWLVYDSDTPADRWQLYARNVVTGRVIPLDSPSREGVPSRFLHADSDGETVVWQSWTRSRGHIVSVIRSYDLASGSRRTLLEGGTGRDYFYGYPEIDGNRVVLVKEPGNGANSQILLEGRSTHHLRVITPPSEPNYEPAISGDIVTWVHGSLTIGHKQGLVVDNLATDQRVALRHSSAQNPRVVSGRYVVFATHHGRASVQIYDAWTGRRRTIVAGEAPGYGPGQIVEVGGDMVLFRMSRPCSAAQGLCPSTFTLVSIG